MGRCIDALMSYSGDLSTRHFFHGLAMRLTVLTNPSHGDRPTSNWRVKVVRTGRYPLQERVLLHCKAQAVNVVWWATITTTHCMGSCSVAGSCVLVMVALPSRFRWDLNPSNAIPEDYNSKLVVGPKTELLKDI